MTTKFNSVNVGMKLEVTPIIVFNLFIRNVFIFHIKRRVTGCAKLCSHFYYFWVGIL